MADQQAVCDAIYTKLTAVQTVGTVHALTGGRIYEGQAPLDEALPFLVFNIISDVPDSTFDGDNLDAEVQVTYVGGRGSGSKVTRTIADAGFTLLQNATDIAITGYNRAETWCVDRGTLDVEDDAYVIRQTWALQGS